MRGLREKTQEEARRGAGRTGPPEGQGGEEGLEAGRTAGGGQSKDRAEVERQIQRREAERQAPERAWSKIRRGQNAVSEVRDFRQAQGQAGSGKPGIGLTRLSRSRHARPCARH